MKSKNLVTEVYKAPQGPAVHMVALSPPCFLPHLFEKNGVPTAVLRDPMGSGPEGRAEPGQGVGGSGGRGSAGLPPVGGSPARLAKPILMPAFALPGLARFHTAGWKGRQSPINVATEVFPK